MNNKAFTLIELLGVLMIIAIIATVVTITVDRSIKNSRLKTCQAQEKNIIEAAKNWMTDNPNVLTLNDDATSRTIEVYLKKQNNGTNMPYNLQEKIKSTGERVENAYIEEGLESPMTDKPYSDNTRVKITVSKYKNRQNYEYEIIYGDVANEKCQN